MKTLLLETCSVKHRTIFYNLGGHKRTELWEDVELSVICSSVFTNWHLFCLSYWTGWLPAPWSFNPSCKTVKAEEGDLYHKMAD